MAVPRQAACSTLLRSRANPARPYMVCLIILSRLIWPSTGLVDHDVPQRGPDRSVILPKAFGEASERRSGRASEPAIERSCALLPDQGGEAISEALDLRQGAGSRPAVCRGTCGPDRARRPGPPVAGGSPEGWRAASTLPFEIHSASPQPGRCAIAAPVEGIHCFIKPGQCVTLRRRVLVPVGRPSLMHKRRIF